jgi:hypothetical protein
LNIAKSIITLREVKEMKVLDLEKVKDLTNERLDRVEKSKRYLPTMSIAECVGFTRDIIIESEDVKAFREDVYKIPFVNGCWIMPNYKSIIIEVSFGLYGTHIKTKYFNFVKVTTTKYGISNRIMQVDIEDDFDDFADIKEEVKKISNEIAKEINDKTIEFYSLLKEYGINLEQLGKINDYIDKNKQYIDYVKINKKMKEEN